MSREDGKNWSAQSYTRATATTSTAGPCTPSGSRSTPRRRSSSFDAPDRETCTVRRARTNTPLQALVLLNDPTYVEASRKLAERLIREGGSSVDDRLTLAFRLVLARRPSARELDVLRQVHRDALAKFRADQEAAAKLLAVAGGNPWRPRSSVRSGTGDVEHGGGVVLITWPRPG